MDSRSSLSCSRLLLYMWTISSILAFTCSLMASSGMTTSLSHCSFTSTAAARRSGVIRSGWVALPTIRPIPRKPATNFSMDGSMTSTKGDVCFNISSSLETFLGASSKSCFPSPRASISWSCRVSVKLTGYTRTIGQATNQYMTKLCISTDHCSNDRSHSNSFLWSPR
eukprot:Nitzschia sp. Nitz4//scaffold56_size114212//39518//40194//NITZ4_003941-RA/size114212-est2genome-gene-0.16-mRNA-1//-1//CDS//3329554679//8713//frame0